MTNHPDPPRLTATVWLLHEHGQRLLAAEGLTAPQAWQAFHPLERAAVFNQVELHIDPSRAPDAISRWGRLAGRTGICIAQPRLVTPRTIAFDAASPSNPAFHDPAKLLRMPYDARPVAIPPRTDADRERLLEHLADDHSFGAESLGDFRIQPIRAATDEHELDHAETDYEHGYLHPSVGLEPPR